MRESSKESSTYDRSILPLPEFQTWRKILQNRSPIYQKYRSFLKTQEELLQQIYRALKQSQYRVVNFTEPPASGKTHVIAICASYLHNLGFATCIVTPCNELKSDFVKDMEGIDFENATHPPVYNLNFYRRIKHRFDFVFIDEAHNLRSAIEMDSEIVKTIHLEKDESLFEAIEYRLERKGEYSATELNIESAVDILKTMKGTMYEREARKILKTISQWRAFCIYHNSSLDIKFLHADPTMRDMLPRGRMFLFSATRLRTEELQFYCNIPRNMCDMVGTTHEAFSPKKNVTYYYITCNLDSDKENITRSMLAGTNIRTLMLFNNNSTCQIWGRALSSGIKDRIMVIPSGLDYRDRTKLFNSFLERDNAILLTSSSVYWEGINIKNLRLLIIPYSPFPQPSILEISQGRQTDYKGIAKRRLIQGLGRIGRSPQDSGICLMLFDPEISWDRVTRVPVGEAKAFVTGLTTVDA